MAAEDCSFQMSQEARESGVLGITEALAVFDWLADMEDLAFNYRTEGCQDRMDVMCRRLKLTGLNSSKAWIAKRHDDLEFSFPGEDEKHCWHHHYAMALPVRQTGGVVENMIFDPALFDGPVSVHEWAYALNADEADTKIERHYSGILSLHGRFSEARSDEFGGGAKSTSMLLYMKDLAAGDFCRAVWPSSVRDDIEGPVSRRGATWQTYRPA